MFRIAGFRLRVSGFLVAEGGGGQCRQVLLQMSNPQPLNAKPQTLNPKPYYVGINCMEIHSPTPA